MSWIHSVLRNSFELTLLTLRIKAHRDCYQLDLDIQQMLLSFSRTFICWVVGWWLESNTFKSSARETEAVEPKKCAAVLMSRSSKRCMAGGSRSWSSVWDDLWPLHRRALQALPYRSRLTVFRIFPSWNLPTFSRRTEPSSQQLQRTKQDFLHHLPFREAYFPNEPMAVLIQTLLPSRVPGGGAAPSAGPLSSAAPAPLSFLTSSPGVGNGSLERWKCSLCKTILSKKRNFLI